MQATTLRATRTNGRTRPICKQDWSWKKDEIAIGKMGEHRREHIEKEISSSIVEVGDTNSAYFSASLKQKNA